MSPARQKAEAVTREYKVDSTWAYNGAVFVRLHSCSRNGSSWGESYGVLTIQVPQDKAADYLPNTVCEVTIVNKKKQEERDVPAVLRQIGTANGGPR